MKTKLLLFAIFLSGLSFAMAQSRAIHATGTILEAKTNQPLTGVNVVFISKADSTLRYGNMTGNEGSFDVIIPTAGNYLFRATFIGYIKIEQEVNVPRAGLKLGTLIIKEDVLALGQVEVEATQERVEVKGDTLVYNADAYKVTQNANAEDLVTKMPGVVVKDGTVEAQGETVRRILVDGQEFFGNDATLALRNLPAEVIEKVEVFERLSEQSQFTGFDDGNREMTLNIVTRSGRNTGQFGNIYAGYGTEERYRAGGNISLFDNTRRISVIGMSNNINQQNFSQEDLLGVVGTNSNRRGGGSRSGGDRGGRGGGFSGRGGSTSNFLVGQQGGINTTHAFGLNYTDKWNEKMTVNGSYFYNQSNNASDTSVDRDYLLQDAISQTYVERNLANSKNDNHRLNLRLDYNIDERNSLTIRPQVSVQNNFASSFLSGINSLPSNLLLSTTQNDYESDNKGYNASSSFLFRHRFNKPGRTISANFDLSLNDRWGDTNQISDSKFYDITGTNIDSLITYDQWIDNQTDGQSYSLNLAYTEPLSETGQLQFNYTPRLSKNASEREAFQLNDITGLYDIPEPSYSSFYDNDVMTQRAGVSIRSRKETGFFNLGVNVQQEKLLGTQTLPLPFEVNNTFYSILPSLMMRFGQSREQSMFLMYRTSTDTPSINQLQSVIDNTNPLSLSTGNPNLSPSYSHTLVARINKTNAKEGKVLIGYISGSLTNDYISNERLIAVRDTTISPGVVLLKGSQFSRPINLDGYRNVRTFFSIGRPVPFLKSNLNLNLGGSYTTSPSLINNVSTTTNGYNVNGGFVLGSNISKQVDFTITYTLNYNRTLYSTSSELNDTYFQHRTNVKFTLTPMDKLVIESNFDFASYAGVSGGNLPSIALWNGGIGYRFLKNDAGELKLAVADILNQNQSINRNVTDLYIENSESQILQRYVLLNFTYQLRNFKIN